MKVWDLHCDTLSELRKAEHAGRPKSFAQNDLHIDLEKLQKGDYLLQCFAAFVNLDDPAPAERLRFITESVAAITDGTVPLVFDITLIRGQGYYTGPVFEVRSEEFRGAIAGGGRYDRLIGKFLGEEVPAVGFSIGFERICAILADRGFTPPTTRRRIAMLYYPDQLVAAARAAEEMRGTADVSLIEKSGKVGKLIARCEAYGFDAIAEVTAEGVTVKELTK